jgi:ribosome-binding factor A
MTVAGHRHERIAVEIRQEISVMLAGELKDPRLAGLATVTEVRVTPDLKQARVYVSVMGTETERASTLKGLTAAAGFIRHELSERLRLRRAPEVSFVLDRSEEYGQRIDDLFRRMKSSG